MVYSGCRLCRRVFYVKPSWLKKGHGKYCSLDCASQARRKGKFVNCEICGKKIWRKPKYLKASKFQKFFCNKTHQLQWRSVYYLGKKHPNWKHGKYEEYKGILVRKGVIPRCSLCGCKDERVLAVHHLDRDKKNNRVENLGWLCLNCHYLVHGFNVKFEYANS